MSHGAALAASEPSPYQIPSRKLGIWMFILADAATFGAMLFAYGYLRVANPDWNRPFAFWPSIVNGIGMTVILLTSSLTMVAAMLESQRGRTSAALRWLGATMALGALFAALHLREWVALIGSGWRLFRNPLGGTPLVGATFFSITGLHMLHVISGVVVIGVIGLGFRRGRFPGRSVGDTGPFLGFLEFGWGVCVSLRFLF